MSEHVENFKLPSGDIYTGDLFGKVPYGHGNLIFKNGDVYNGSFDKNGRRCGYGKRINIDGS